MTDDINLNAGSGGATIKTDDDGTAHWQYVKISFGDDDTQTRVTESTGLPVNILAGTAEIGNIKNSGTFVVQEDGAALTALQVIDNIVHIDDAAFTLGADSGVMMMGFAGTQSVDANDAGALSMETDGSLHIHDGGNSITIDNADIATIAGAVSGSEMQVDVVASLPAGTNAIGKLAANSGVDIGDVDVLSVVPGTGATNLGKAIDSAVGATDTGLAILAERIDVQAAITPAVGDYTNLFSDKFGNLKTTQLPDADSVVKRQVINVAGSGDNTLQAAAGSGIRIRVLSYTLVAGGAVTARFESNPGGDPLTGQMEFAANGGTTVPFNPYGHFETSANQLLNLELSAAVNVDGHFTYVEVTS